jgi:hypothetical protein
MVFDWQRKSLPEFVGDSIPSWGFFIWQFLEYVDEIVDGEGLEGIWSVIVVLK